MYLKYTYATGAWGNMHDFLEKNQVRDVDIVLDTLQHPNIVWGGDAGYYSNYNGINWTETETITMSDPFNVAIESDSNNKLHITLSDDNADSMKLFYFHKPNGIDWEKKLVDQCDNAIFTPELELFNDVLYLTYNKSEEPGYSDVFITKLDLLTSVKYPHTCLMPDITLHQNYPNPFNNKTTIYYQLKEQGEGYITVFNNVGEVIREVSFSKAAGIHNIVLDMGNLPAGIYYYSMVINGKRTDSKKMVIVR